MAEISLAHRLLKSSFWEYLGSWINKLIGFIATLILARILLPSDFGVVAAASIVTGFFHVIASVGTDQYLLRKKIVNYSEYDTGWTINIIMKSLSAIGVFMLAPPIAQFMGDPRITLVLQVSSITPLLYGFTNIGLILYQKDYNYKPQFILTLYSRIIGFIIKIALAYYFRSYWAFIVAEICEAIVNVLGSFILHKFRPRLSLKHWKQQWSFSQWILLKSIFVFLRLRVDNIFISKYLPIEALGIYSVAKDVATLPAGQIIEPIMQPLYVGLSSVRDDAILFADKIHKVLSMVFLIIIPISFGTYATANNLVYILLGQQWQQAIPIVQIVAFMLIPGTLSHVFTKVMTVMGRVKLIFKFEVLLSVIAITAFALLAKTMTLNEFALLRVIIITFNTLIVLSVLTILSKLSFFRIIGLLIIPLIAAFSMVIFLENINKNIIILNPYYQLSIQVISGAIVYYTIITCFIYLFRKIINEYQFIWKTFYLSLFGKK